MPWRTVDQNIRLVLDANQQRVSLDELYQVLELGEVQHFYPGQLSLGLARRAALARAFVLNPQLLILDEPFVSLDDATAHRLRQLLMSLWNKHHTTALMVTHNVREAALLADRILVFSKRPSRIVDELVIDVERDRRDAPFVESVVQQLHKLVQLSEDDV